MVLVLCGTASVNIVLLLVISAEVLMLMYGSGMLVQIASAHSPFITFH